jgi:hypothetical protein
MSVFISVAKFLPCRGPWHHYLSPAYQRARVRYQLSHYIQSFEAYMNTSLVRRRTPWSLTSVIVSVALVAACEDARVKAVDTGMTRDQAINELARNARGTGPDSMPNVYRRSEYLIDSKRYEVLYYTEDNAKLNRDTVEYSDLTPIVLIENKVVGKGWAFWDSLAATKKIPVPKHD